MPTIHPTPDALRIPDDWEILAGADTGTYMAGLICAIPPTDDPPVYVLEEFPNYHYVGGTIELSGFTVRQWIARFAMRLRHYTHDTRNHAWVDRNTTFVTEIAHGLTLRRNHIHGEVRTEVTREYFQLGKVLLAPWLTVLPYEVEHAKWPDHETSSGRFVRAKSKDHTLDCLEHICSRRPLSVRTTGQAKPRFLDRYLTAHQHTPTGPADIHLGDL
jgi:hypothetical protein